MVAEQKPLSVTSTHAIQPLPSPFGVRVGVDELDPTDPNGVIATWLTALKTLKANNNFNDEMSYFRLAAIHGAPYVGWDGVDSDGALEANGNFCTHGQNTFPTWHRIYMILFENALYNVIPDSDKNKASFRIPYWDWAKNDQGSTKTPLPLLLQSQFWPLKSKTENPLWRFVNPNVYDANAGTGKPEDLRPYPFGDVEMGQYVIGNDLISNGSTSLWSVTRSTSRCVLPGSQDFVNGNNNMGLLMTNLKNAGWYNNKYTPEIPPYKTISDYVYGLMSWQYTSFNSFATTAYDPVPGANDPNRYGWLSLEYLHNNLHNWIGGPDEKQIGHMNDVPVAAFDPIFWLHHTFIDALFAAWQGLPQNQNLWLDNDSATEPLEPFHTDTNGTFFTSNNVKQINDWKYSYSAFPTTSDRQRDLIKMINHKYGNGMQHVVGSAIKDEVPGAKNDYIINVLHALDQAYKIHFFLGEIEANIADSNLMAHPNHVGSVYTFSNSGRSRCSNCSNQKALNKLSRAQILLTVPLIQHQREGFLAHLKPEGNDGVQKYLKKTLTWRVVKRDGTDVPVKDNPNLSDLKIILAQGKADHFPEDDTRLSVFHGDSYNTFWQGSYPGQDSEPPESYIIKNH